MNVRASSRIRRRGHVPPSARSNTLSRSAESVRVRQSLIDHRVDRAVERQRDVLDVAQRRRQADAGERQPVQRVVDRTRHQAPQAESLQPLGVPQPARRQVVHALNQRPEVLAEQGIGDHPQGRLDHRLVHVESGARSQRVGDVRDRVDHQVDDAVEVAPGEGRVQHPAVRGPGIALVGEQIDARGRLGWARIRWT